MSWVPEWERNSERIWDAMGSVQSDDTVTESLLREPEDSDDGAGNLHLSPGVCMERESVSAAELHVHWWSEGEQYVVSDECDSQPSINHDLLCCVYVPICDNQWKCGCRDTQCTTNYWQLQKVS